MHSPRILFALFFTAILVTAAAQVFAGTHDAPGPPDLTDPDVVAQFIPLSISRFGEDPDFPVLLLANRSQEPSQFLMVIVDARNGKDTWSIREDAAVFYLLLDDSSAIQRAFLDEGFAAGGNPSGRFLAAGPEGAGELVGRLLESHHRSRALARMGQRI